MIVEMEKKDKEIKLLTKELLDKKKGMDPLMEKQKDVLKLVKNEHKNLASQQKKVKERRKFYLKKKAQADALAAQKQQIENDFNTKMEGFERTLQQGRQKHVEDTRAAQSTEARSIARHSNERIALEKELRKLRRKLCVCRV